SSLLSSSRSSIIRPAARWRAATTCEDSMIWDEFISLIPAQKTETEPDNRASRLVHRQVGRASETLQPFPYLSQIRPHKRDRFPVFARSRPRALCDKECTTPRLESRQGRLP